MAKAEKLHYTDKELEAIAILTKNRGVKMSAKELRIPTAILTSLAKKANDEREVDNGEKVVINKEDFTDVCPTCGAKISHKLYWID